MTIEIAPRATAVAARVEHVDHLCREHVIITCSAAGVPASEPGQFLQLLCSADGQPEPQIAEWTDGAFPTLTDADTRERRPYLRRPFSIADRWEQGGRSHLQVISRAVGVGTRWLDALRPGDGLDLSGPLGRGFRIPGGPRPLVLIGGGVGIPPLLYLARALHAARRTDVTVLFGVMSRDLLPVRLLAEPRTDGSPTPCLQLPAAAPFPALVTSDDGSIGLRGRVTDGLRALGVAPGALVCACGPERMLAAVAALTRELRLDCQLCIERNMGCGLGTCLSCVARVRAADKPQGWRWALACTEGPVFDRDDLVDEGGGHAA